ncbi:MAG: hypothetical protein M3Y27_09055 [Acidobacteriota bacterium]|nr:hypothetical protein [Acidobacteriota bacterium]
MLLIYADGGLGILHRLTGVIAQHRGDITSIGILDQAQDEARVYFEVTTPGVRPMLEDLRSLWS